MREFALTTGLSTWHANLQRQSELAGGCGLHRYLVRGSVMVACKISHSHGLWCCSRCTGYRPILDAFKVFAKADPAAYTEESIAASQGLQPDGHAPAGPSATGHPNGGADGHSSNGNAATTDGHANGGSTDSSHAANGHKADKHAENGHCNGHDASSSNGTVKELTAASKSNGRKVPPPPPPRLPPPPATPTVTHPFHCCI